MVFLQERIGKLLENINDLIYKNPIDIKNYKIKKTTERYSDINNLDTSKWDDFSYTQIWGGHREYYWFETTVTIPEEFDGECVVYELITGREKEWDATNPQFTIYINGKLIQGMDVNHRSVILTENAKKGESYRIVLSAFTGDQNFSLLLKSQLKILDKKTEKYFYDLSVPFNVARLLSREDKAYIEIITNLNESLNLLDLRKEHSKEYYASLEKAQDYIKTQFYDKKCGDTEAVIYCVGHTHIDVAWLWTLAVTEDKSVRSFSTVLELMRRYPEYIFMSSQAQLYKYVKKNAPQVYEEIKERVAEGRWEINGGMWVEADCNIASGESLVRQFLYGQRFFKQEFNQDNNILWLPDVFGYSAALPQIMKKCGLPYFMTTKISWNEMNKLPYDTFMWEGIDGTKVLTHFSPSRDYNEPAKVGSEHTGHFTTYNAYINPSQVKGNWQRYQQKHINNETLMSFGFGDGGGGPTKDMLENQRRLEKGIPGSPKTKPSTAKDFFAVLDKNVSNNKYLPTWSGELYLEYHRGTYTSMARNKKFNRKSEFATQNIELYALLDSSLNGTEYPQEQINNQWEVILRNQFHDILPGSSIKDVYEDSKVEYEGLFNTVNQLTDSALVNITANINAPKNSITVYNPNGFDSCDLVSFVVPSGIVNPVVYDGDTKLTCQKTPNGYATFKAVKVPAKGYKTFALKDEKIENCGCTKISSTEISNKFFDIKLNEKGQFTSIFDKTAGREVLQPGTCANVIMSYEDRPHNYDAWDVNNYYNEKSWEIDDVQSIEVVENGSVRSCLKISRKYLDSTLTQYIYVYNDIARIDIKNEIDWKEHQIFVKALFPVDVHSNEATYDIQYGNVTRATHYNTSWDFARFEVCYHKWMDLSEDNFGVSIINDCKYGCNVNKGVIGFSMLKSAIYPNPDADKEFHEFTFSIYPHTGSWKTAKTVNEAYKLNNPLVAVIKQNESGTLAPSYSAVKSNNENVIIEVVKKAEDSDAAIVRLYECYNRRTDASITFAQEIASIEECDMMENAIGQVDKAHNTANFSILPYEIKTFKVCFK